MPKFEFKLLSATEIVDLERVINSAGAEGFDVIQAIPVEGRWYAMMKRSVVSNFSSPPAPKTSEYVPVMPIKADATKTTVFPPPPKNFGRKNED